MKLARNSLYSLLASILPIALSVITVPIYVGQIGNERYGALAVAWLLLGYFGQADFGMGRAITQRISSMQGSPRAQQADAVLSAMASMVLFGLVGGVLVYLSASYYFADIFKVTPTVRAEILSAAWLLAACNPLVAFNGVLAGALMGQERFKVVSACNLFSSSALIVFPLLTAFLFGVDLRYLVLAALASRALGTAVLAAWVWMVFLRGERARVRRAELRRLFNFGSWIMITALVAPIMSYADRFIIGAVQDAVAVAAYSIAYQIASRTQVFPLAVVQSLFPRFAAEQAETALARCRDFAAFIAQIFAPVVIGLICLAGPLLELWLGRNLDQRSISIGQITLVGFWFNSVAHVPFAFIQARGDPRFTASLHVVELPLYLALLFVLGGAFGLAGISAAFTLRCLADCLLLIWRAGIFDRALALRLLGHVAIIGVALTYGLLAEPGWIDGLIVAGTLASLSVLLLLFQIPEAIRVRLLPLPVVGAILRVRPGG